MQGWARPCVRAILFAAASLAVTSACALRLPGGTAVQWACFVAAALLAACAVCSHPDGFVFGAAGLFGAIALKDGLLVVPAAHVNLFHVLFAGLVLAALGTTFGAYRHRPLHPESSCTRPLFIKPRGMEWGLIALLVAGLWSLVESIAPTVTLIAIARLLLMVAIALLIARLLPDERSRLIALETFVWGSLVIAALALVQWLVPCFSLGNVHVDLAAGGKGVQIRPAAFYLDPNFLAAHLTAASLVALGLASRGRKWALWVLAAAGMLGVVALTLSRSAWLAAATGVIVLAVTGGTRVRRISITVILATGLMALTLVGPSVLLTRAGSMFDTSEHSSNVTRVLMARSSLEMIADYPLFGTGLGTFDRVYPDYMIQGANPEITHPHQVILATIAETGIVGAAAFALLIITGGAAMLRVCRRRPPHERAIVAALAALGVASLFQYFLFFEVAWLLAGLLCSAAADASASANASEGEPSPRQDMESAPIASADTLTEPCPVGKK